MIIRRGIQQGAQETLSVASDGNRREGDRTGKQAKEKKNRTTKALDIQYEGTNEWILSLNTRRRVVETGKRGD